MAGRKRGNGGGNRIATMFMSILVVIIVSVVIIDSGAWSTGLRLLSISGLNPLTSSQQLKPSEEYQKLGPNKITIPTPTATASPTPEVDETPDSTPQPTETPTEEPRQTVEGLPSAALPGISMTEALSMAKAMKTATPHTQGYDRETEFGTWANSSQLCGYGTTRDQILKRDMTDVTMDAQCRVTSGTLHDPYTGSTINFQRSVKKGKITVSGDSTRVQIDHVVALNDAWASGLWKDSRAKDRVRYANDPDVLLASDGPANNAKSMGINLTSSGVPASLAKQWKTSTPSIWLPDNQEYRCNYMAKRVQIKHKWNLTMSAWEKRETVSYLAQCATD